MPVEVLVPPVGTNVDVVTLSIWYVQEGESVAAGAPLFAVETDKATLDIEAPGGGVLRSVTARAGDEVRALSRIAVIEDGAAGAPVADRTRDTQHSTPTTQYSTPNTQHPAAAPQSSGHRVFISPRARTLAEEQGIAWRNLAGTGPEGAIVVRDVQAALERPRPDTRHPIPDTRYPTLATPMARRVAADAGVDLGRMTGSGPAGKITRSDVEQAAAGFMDDGVVETIQVSGIRAIISERMAYSSSTSAPVTLTTEVDATALVEARSALAGDGLVVSYNDLLLAILGRALKEHPRINASLDGSTIRVWRRIDVGLAVDTERGLVVPVVRGVDRKSLAEIAAESARMVAAVQAGKAQAEELSGGTFTLTNLGMFRIDAFTPIINMPECAILGVGRIKTQPAIVEGQVVARKMMWLSLTFDHRLVDGGPAARFLQRVAQLTEQPVLLLRGGG
jgi:pyruvate dehydrogenase E2 component (dihydrolipoamide acetyltransferase)